MAEIGQRVGAILRAEGAVLSEEEPVRFLGFGIYEGRFPAPAYPPIEQVFPQFNELSREEQISLRRDYEQSKMAHRIRLDSGDIVWGKECLWGPEAIIRRALFGKRKLDVKIIRWPMTGLYKSFMFV